MEYKYEHAPGQVFDTIEQLLGAYLYTVEKLRLQHLPAEAPKQEFEKALFELIKSHIFQLGALGGSQYPRTAEKKAGYSESVTNGVEDGEGCPGDLKRCPDGSCVPHGIGCLGG